MSVRNLRGRAALTIIVVAVSLFLQWLMLEHSMAPIGTVLQREVPVNLLNLAAAAVPFFLLLLLTGRPLVSTGIMDVCCFGLSLANRYVCDLHGAPIRISELASLGTGLQVLSGYKFYLPDIFGSLVCLLAAGLLLLTAVRLLTRPRRGERNGKRRLPQRIAGLLCGTACAAAVAVCFATGALRPEIAYNWPVAVRQWGYPLCLVEDTLRYGSCTVMPEGYTDEAARDAAGRHDAQAGTGQLPDIVLILNETFYDPARYAALGLQTDVPYLQNFYAIEGVSRGYAMIPVGGTNSSEYELLTANSKTLVNASAPFNFLRFDGANTVVSYVRSLGYETWALHDLEGTNYTRYKSWPEMGFDHVLFQQDFTELTRYGTRYGTDAGDYRQLIECYEQGGDGPRFLYLLTYQNHGGWEQNDPELDTVHCLTDLGSDTGLMNEYLTGIRMSDEALTELLDYFRDCGRDVIVAMVGDHPPVFLSSRSDAWLTENYTDDDVLTYIEQTATPYLLWRSTGSTEGWPELITLADLVPMIAKTGGLPLSPYYSALLQLQKEYPVHISGFLVSPEGKLTRLDGTSSTPQSLKDWLYLGYNNLQDASRRIQTAFTPSGT